jgi:hypothetical protein
MGLEEELLGPEAGPLARVEGDRREAAIQNLGIPIQNIGTCMLNIIVTGGLSEMSTNQRTDLKAGKDGPR